MLLVVMIVTIVMNVETAGIMGVKTVMNLIVIIAMNLDVMIVVMGVILALDCKDLL